MSFARRVACSAIRPLKPKAGRVLPSGCACAWGTTRCAASPRSPITDAPPAATFGQLLGLVGTGGTPLAVPVTWLGTNESYERATLTLHASAVLAGASPSPLAALTLPARYLHSARPLEEVRGRVWKHTLQGESPKEMLDAGVMTGLSRTWKDPYKFLYDSAKGMFAHHNKLDSNMN